MDADVRMYTSLINLKVIMKIITVTQMDIYKLSIKIDEEQHHDCLPVQNTYRVGQIKRPP